MWVLLITGASSLSNLPDAYFVMRLFLYAHTPSLARFVAELHQHALQGHGARRSTPAAGGASISARGAR